jgi:fatty acid desaturase
MSIICAAIALMMNPLDKIDELLRRARSKSPILGWTLTVLFMPIALAIGLGFIALALVFGPAIPLVAGVWLIMFLIFSAIGRYSEEYKPDRLLAGAAGNVILTLGIIITILAVAVIVQLPDRWLERLHIHSPSSY